ncbi:proton-conducting transporter membrane subunit [Pyrobaculum sp.]|uniref:proton-conducting transporter transmembrane domain-containing protein n=1 Tax=Pyrobaculum sp. TaxID=2004705 RepID=UPI003D0BBF0D
MVPLELLLLLIAIAAVADLFTRRGIGAALAGGFTTYLAFRGELHPATQLLRVGDQTAQLIFFISGVYTSIVLYSMWYVKDVERRGWFWLWMGVFYASMLSFVAADHWAVLMLGWGGLDLASWALILTYRDEEEAGWVGGGDVAGGLRWLWTPSASALRAILTVEMGTASLIAGLGLAAAQSPYISHWHALPDVAAALVLVAAFAKAAQLPFTDWLMTAMSAPTPVSALLHSSTMVKAGPILLLKLGGLMPQWAGHAAFAVGIATALYGGLVALGQREPKVLLAASTASYLGLITAFALAKPEEAVALIYAHGVAKATLFMAVGHGIHLTHSRTPAAYPLPAKVAMVLSLLTLLGLTPLGAEAKAHADPWLLIFSALTAGYVGKLLAKSGTAAGGWGAALPYLTLSLAAFAVAKMPNFFWALALAGLLLAKTSEYTPLYRRFWLPLAYDMLAPRLLAALTRAVAKFDGYIDRKLMGLPSVWGSLASTVAALDKSIDLALHRLLPTAVKTASLQVARRNFEFYLYVAGVGVGALLVILTWLWTR